MLIENPDAFKSWLTSVLEPLCDADPEALAKYVFALVKKDKTADVLRQGMLEQLDVFLQSETKPFVEMLFKTLDTQEYLMPVIPNANPPNPHVPALVVAKKDTIAGSTSPVDQLLVKEMKPIIPVSTLPNLSESINGSIPAAAAAGGAAVVTGSGGGIVVKKDSGGDSTGPVLQKPSQPLLHRKSDSEKEERTRSGRGRHRSNSRNRSRSRSWERTKRSRSPRSDRSPRGERERRDRSRPWRNKSPPRGSSRYDRRRSRTGSPIGGGGGGGGGGRLRSRSRSPRHTYRGNRYRNRSPPPRSVSRSRSRSNDRIRSEKDNKKDSKVSDAKDMQVGKDENSGGATPTQDSNHGDTDMRLTSTTQSIQSVVSALNPSSGAVAGTNAGLPPGAPKRRCRDFDEKGYCMRGEMCPYDHGVDPVVLEDTALSRVLTFGPGGPNGAAPGVVNVDGAPLSVPPGLLHHHQQHHHHHHHAHSTALLPSGPGVPPPPPPGAVLQHMPGGPPPVNIPTGVRVSSGGGHPEYNPSAPGMHWLHRPGGFRGPPRPMMPRGMPQMGGGGGGPFQPLPSMQRELINVQVTDNTHSTSNTNTGPGGGGGGGSMAGYKRRADYQHHDGSPDHGLMGTGGVGGGPPAPKRKQGFDFNRLGPRAGKHHANNPVNCSLELKKVPRGLNNITHLNNHFSKFGKIVNIQVCYDGDPEGAIVTFSSHAEANAAYRSTEAVLNNRFIKVFWHSSSGGLNNNNNMDRQENVPPSSSGPVRPVKDRLGQPVCGGNKVLNLVQPKAITTPAAVAGEDDTLVPGEASTTGGGGAATAVGDNSEDETKAAAGGNSVYVPSSMKRDLEQSRALANAAIVKSQEILAAKEQLKKKHEEKRKEALKITQDLRKRKQELLEKQLAQQKLLIEKLEKTNPTGQQRELLMTTIKTVQESIESIRKDMMSTPSPAKIPAPGTAAGPLGPVRKSREEAQREVLDAELDLITKQAEGGDTSELQRRLLELRAQAYTLTRSGGPAGTGVRGGARRGRGPARALLSKNNLIVDNNNRNSVGHTRGGRGGGGGAVPGGAVFQKHTVVDHRPTRLLVSGYEGDESDSVLAHFAQYGEIIDYVTDNSTPSIVLNYKMRKEAEIALLKGKNFQDRTLSVTWCTSPQRSMQRSNSISSGTGTGTAGRPVLLSESTTEDQLLEGGDDETVLNEPLGVTELSEEALLQDDEEEEDENEDRSWRR
ncbi:second mitotic wave missing [Carabus blaptoides fortunei]